MLEKKELFPPVVDWKQVKESIIKNENAVYGYSPRPDSVSIGIHADWHWEDEDFVAYAKKVRIHYREELTAMYALAQKMYQEGSSDEKVARTISEYRNKERLHAYDDNPEAMTRFCKNNEKRYGTQQGILADAAYEKYGSWEKVLEKSLSINLGMDVCCGLCKVINSK